MMKTYYKIIMTLQSPLSIGTSDTVDTDRDVLLDKRGTPFIPASSLCGVYRSYFSLGKAKEIFGVISTENEIKSQVRVYDSALISDCFKISDRDNVALQRTNKVAKKGQKFDCQIVEPGIEFKTFIELIDDADYASDIEEMLAAVNSGDLRFGAKTTRGYGRFTITVNKIQFTDVDKWLDFDMFDDACWKNAEELTFQNSSCTMHTIALKLKQVGGISVREYFADANDGTTDVPDYKQLSFKSNGEPVIPATSWAGAFRTRYQEFASSGETDMLFGPENNGKDSKLFKSKIVFDESRVEGSTPKILTRNAIDRFTGGTKDGALYTEETRYNGTTSLEIRVPRSFTGNLEALIAVILDLDNGLLSVGGLTSVGRGMFTISKATLNAIDITDLIKKSDIKSIVSKMKEG